METVRHETEDTSTQAINSHESEPNADIDGRLQAGTELLRALTPQLREFSFAPNASPEIARAFGKALRDFMTSVRDISDEVRIMSE